MEIRFQNNYQRIKKIKTNPTKTEVPIVQNQASFVYTLSVSEPRHGEKSKRGEEKLGNLAKIHIWLGEENFQMVKVFV